MSDNNLIDVATNDTVITTHMDQYNDALEGDLIPRNTDGTPETNKHSLGEEANKWARLFVSNACWSAGDLKPHHTYDGLVSVEQGWYPCDGSLIGPYNYDLLFGEGSWEEYIQTSVFETKHAPNLLNAYLVGASSTPQDGAINITNVGNENNTTDLSHYHFAGSHNHHWYAPTGGTTTRRFYTGNNGGTNTTGSYSSGSGNKVFEKSDDNYTNADNPPTNTKLSITTDIQPESIQVIYYIRII